VADPGTSPTVHENYPQLLSLAVHELRTPASVVGGYLRMLQRDVDPPLTQRHKKLVDEAERSCARIVALIAELSEVSRLDSGTAAVSEERFDLFETLSNIAGEVDEARDRDVHLELRGPSVGAPMKGDLLRLRSAFTAVFRAVLREQPASCTVVAERRLEPGADRPLAVTVVAEASSVQRAFEARAAPFDEKRGGLGLLLPIARRVLERHGGRIWSPAAPGPTAAILVSLPLDGNRTLQPPEPPP
jgi:two-component system cell cycle sensor histidine kinase PleC